MRTVPLGAVADLAARIGWHGLSTDDYRDEGDWLVAGTDFEGGAVSWNTCNRVEPRVWSRDPRIQLSPEDVLVTKDGTIGKTAHVGVLPGRATLASGVFRVTGGPSLDSRYLYWLLNSGVMKEFQGRLGGGSTINHLYQRDFKNFPVPVIPRHEQRRIADFLDDQVARINQLVDERRRQDDLARELFMTGLSRVFAGRDVVPLNLLVRRDRPVNYGVLMPGPDVEGGVRLVEARDVGRGPLEVGTLRRCDPTIEEEYRRSRLQAGDLVMAIRGSVGAVQLVPGSCERLNVTRDAARISLRGDLAVPEWVRFVLMSCETQQWMEKRMLGSAVRGINIGDLRRVPVPAASWEEQSSEAGRLVSAEHSLTRTRSSLADSLRLLEERRRSLITAAVMGELDVSTGSSRAAEAVVGG